MRNTFVHGSDSALYLEYKNKELSRRATAGYPYLIVSKFKRGRQVLFYIDIIILLRDNY